MKEAERLAERLETEAAAWEHHGNQSEWRETLRSAAALIRSQAEELERLRGALGEIEIMETNWALGVDDNLERARRLASIVLGK